MKIDICVQDDLGSRTVPVNFSTDGCLEELIALIEQETDVDGLSVIGMVTDGQTFSDHSVPLSKLDFKHSHIQVHRVCVVVHFESESEKHHFPVAAPWARVHRWACRKFKVSADSCGNLELHEDKPDGPAINEKKPIGPSKSCKEVWLVKPGPESNG